MVSVAVLSTGLCLAQTLQIDAVGETLVKNRLTRGEVKHKERQAAIQDLFSKVGAPLKSSGSIGVRGM